MLYRLADPSSLVAECETLLVPCDQEDRMGLGDSCTLCNGDSGLPNSLCAQQAEDGRF